jgi:hypothetical protein
LLFIIQINSVSAQERLTIIDSNPPGAFLTLEGEYRISATTPCRIPDNIIGNYHMKAKMPGFESWSGDIFILPNQDNSFSFKLSPKTRFKASVRSLFIPGWGQYYSGQTFRSLILGFGTIGAGVATLFADGDFRHKRDDYNQAKIDRDNPRTNNEEFTRLWGLARAKNREAYDAETRRNTLIGVTIGIWAYNIIDAALFFPERKLITGLPKIQANFDGQMTHLKLTATF